MKVGDTIVVSYMGMANGKFLFASPLFAELISVAEDKLIGATILDASIKFNLKRQSVSAYYVSHVA